MAAPVLAYEDLGLIQGSGWLFRDLDLFIGSARPAGADRAQRRGQDDAAQVPRRADRDRRGAAHDPAGHQGRAARAGSADRGLSRRCGTSRWRARRAAAPRGRGDRRPARDRSGPARADRQRRRAAAGGDRARAGAGSATCCCSTSRPTISTLPAIEWLEDWLGRYTGRVHRDQPRPHLPEAADPLVALARPRPAAARGGRLRRLRGLDRAGLCRGSARGREARREAQARAALAAARRHRAAQAQPGPARQIARDARGARRDARAGGHGEARAGRTTK